jgi:hypothetical protein
MEGKEIREFKGAKEGRRRPIRRVYKDWNREITSYGSIHITSCQFHLSVLVFSNATQAFEQFSVRARKETRKTHRREGEDYRRPLFLRRTARQ